MYRMEPVDESQKTKTLADWVIELEVGNGIARNFATITDLTHSKATPTPGGNLSVVGGRTLTLPLDELPTLENACETADELALALLEIPGKAKPSDLVLYVFHDGLCKATADNRPLWQRHFRYVAAETTEARVPWWKVIGISNLDDLENAKKEK